MKTVLITGANSGIGLATAKLFLEHNFQVIAHYNSSCQNLEELKSDKLQTFQADLSKAEDIKRLIGKNFSVDVLINNAGVYTPQASFSDISEDIFSHTMDVNLKAPFVLSQHYMNNMRKNKWGRIISISSIGVKYGGGTRSAHYTISKAALEALTLSLAKEGADHNILVNAIRVGVTDTSIHDKNQSKNMDNRVNMIPLKRMATPDEIAKSIMHLSSEDSSFTTGTIVTVAGGE